MVYVEGHPKIPSCIDPLDWLTIRALLAVTFEHVSQSLTKSTAVLFESFMAILDSRTQYSKLLT